jgi:hypothetical protein
MNNKGKEYYKIGNIINHQGIDYVTFGSTCQGLVYKDEEAFVKGVGICYIPEGAFEGNTIEIITYDDLKQRVETIYFELNPIIEKGNTYTRKDLIKIFGNKKRATIGFEILDWQYAETLSYEIVWEDWEE